MARNCAIENGWVTKGCTIVSTVKWCSRELEIEASIERCAQSATSAKVHMVCKSAKSAIETAHAIALKRHSAEGPAL